MPDTSPFMFGEHEVVRPIGAGGMAALYLCKKTGIGGFERQVVVKVLLEEFVDNADFMAMFMDEARLAARLDHPNLVQALDVGKTGELPYIVMDYVQGPNLSRLVKYAHKYKKVDIPAIAWIVGHACKGLHYAHTLTSSDGRPLQIIHRDLSPNNIMVSATGQAKLIDFGVAGGEDRSTKTEAGQLKGKLLYMAPEQLFGEGCDHRVDIFSAGVTLYSATTGRQPFRSKKGVSQWQVRMQGLFDPPSAHVPDYPPELEAIILKAMSVEPDARHPTAKALSEALLHFAAEEQVTQGRVAAWIREIFPEGATQWHISHGAVSLPTGQRSIPPTDGSLITGVTEGTDQITINRETLNRGISALMLTGLMLTGSALLGLGLLLFFLSSGPPEVPEERALTYVVEAERLQEQGQLQAALSTLERAEQAQISDPSLQVRVDRLGEELRQEQHLHRARQALTSGALPTAEREIDAVLTRSPTQPEALALQQELRALRSAPSPDPEPAERAEVAEPPPPPTPTAPKEEQAPVEATGTLVLHTTPSDAVALLDDQPLEEGAALALGPHTLTLSAEGYEPLERPVEVIEGRVELDLTLVPVPAPVAPAPAPAPPPPEAAPAPPPEPQVLLDDATLPSTAEARTINEIASICKGVERSLLAGGVDPKLSKGATGVLMRSLSEEHAPGRATVLYPRGMYRYIAQAAQTSSKPSAIRSGLLKAHHKGQLK